MYENKRRDDISSNSAIDQAPPEPRTFLDAMARRTDPVLGIALTIPSTVIAQYVTSTGCDFVFIDMEHSPMSPELMTQCVHVTVASSRGRCFPVVRVPSHGVEWIKWTMDSGASGIVIPMVNNKTEMNQIAERLLYPPRGKRSFGPARAPWGLAGGPEGGVSSYFEQAVNGSIGIFPMVESVEGVENVEDILAVDGVSGVFVGPMDLRLSMGLTGAEGLEEVYTAAIEKVCKACKKAGKLVGSIGMGDDAIRRRADQGMDFLVVSTDVGAMTTGLHNDLEKATRATQSSFGPSL